MRRWLEIFLHLLFWAFTTWVIYLTFGEAEYELMELNGEVVTRVSRNVGELKHFSFASLFKALLFYINTFLLFPSYLKHKRLRLLLAQVFMLIAVTLFVEMIISNLLLMGPRAIWVFQSPRLSLNLALYIFYLGVSFAYCFGKSWFKNEQQKAELTKEKLSTELAFLKSQVNPHFLFNTLNNLYSMAHDSDKPELADGIARLSELMRYMLYESNSDKVALDHELNYIRSFIEIQKLRLAEEDDFIIQFSVEGNTKDVRIAPMLLIPFVENAFKHGIDFKDSSVIKIELIIEEKELIFSVFNSCPRVSNELEKGKSGIGLENLTRRLELLYYGQYNLEIKPDGEVHGAILKLRLE